MEQEVLVVEEIIDQIDDNEIGKVNTANNWGNTIIIRHVAGLYTQMSHLRKGSFKVGKGDSVKRGDLLASCGNSGRSPQPHIHFQVQISPTLGSRTLDYPFAYYQKLEKGKNILVQFSKPQEGNRVSGVIDNPVLKNAFDLMPNSTLAFKYLNEKAEEITEEWEAYTDAYNFKYLYCKETESYSYYVNDGIMFYFTAFYGNKKSLLYYFYLTAYKVFLGCSDQMQVEDTMPLNIIRNRKFSLWIHDFIAPFYNYICVLYSLKTGSAPSPFETGKIELKSDITVSVFGKLREESVGSIIIENNRISGFTYESVKTKIHAICIDS